MKRYLILIFFSLSFLLSYAKDQQEWEYSFIRALNYEEKNELEKAIEELERSKSLRSGDPMILRELGYCYGVYGNITKAKECYEEVLRIYPKDINALKNLALIEEQLGNLEKEIGGEEEWI